MRKFVQVIDNIKNIEAVVKNELVKISRVRYADLEENQGKSRLTFM